MCLYSKRKGVYCLFFVFLHEGIIQQKKPRIIIIESVSTDVCLSLRP